MMKRIATIPAPDGPAIHHSCNGKAVPFEEDCTRADPMPQGSGRRRARSRKESAGVLGCNDLDKGDASAGEGDDQITRLPGQGLRRGPESPPRRGRPGKGKGRRSALEDGGTTCRP
jgi:hypothetical protein